MRRDVSSVGEGVDERTVLDAMPACQLEQRAQMIDVRMDPAVGDEPEQMDVRTALLRPLEGTDERRVREERAVLDRTVHALEVLVKDAARADRQMADLGVPHLARGQADRLAGSLQRRVRVAVPERVEDRGVGQLDGVPRLRRRATPPVEDDERYERESRAAVSQIAANDSTSREAPPTSAPSTSGWARSSSAFSGLTEPP